MATFAEQFRQRRQVQAQPSSATSFASKFREKTGDSLRSSAKKRIKESALANAQEQASQYAEEAKRAGSFMGLAKETAKGVGSTLLGFGKEILRTPLTIPLKITQSLAEAGTGKPQVYTPQTKIEKVLYGEEPRQSYQQDQESITKWGQEKGLSKKTAIALGTVGASAEILADLLPAGFGSKIAKGPVGQASRRLLEKLGVKAPKAIESVKSGVINEKDLADLFENEGIKGVEKIIDKPVTAGIDKKVIEVPKLEPKKLRDGELAPIVKEIEQTTGKKLRPNEALQVKDNIERGLSKESIIQDIVEPPKLTAKTPKIETPIQIPKESPLIQEARKGAKTIEEDVSSQLEAGFKKQHGNITNIIPEGKDTFLATSESGAVIRFDKQGSYEFLTGKNNKITQPETYYRGEGGNNVAQGKALLAEGRHFAMDSEYPKGFGKVSEYKLRPGAKVLDLGDSTFSEISQKLGIPEKRYISPKELSKIAKEKGYDVLKYNGEYKSTGKPFTHTVELTDNAFIPKSPSPIQKKFSASDVLNKQINKIDNVDLLNEKYTGSRLKPDAYQASRQKGIKKTAGEIINQDKSPLMQEAKTTTLYRAEDSTNPNKVKGRGIFATPQEDYANLYTSGMDKPNIKKYNVDLSKIKTVSGEYHPEVMRKLGADKKDIDLADALVSNMAKRGNYKGRFDLISSDGMQEAIDYLDKKAYKLAKEKGYDAINFTNPMLDNGFSKTGKTANEFQIVNEKILNQSQPLQEGGEKLAKQGEVKAEVTDGEVVPDIKISKIAKSIEQKMKDTGMIDEGIDIEKATFEGITVKGQAEEAAKILQDKQLVDDIIVGKKELSSKVRPSTFIKAVEDKALKEGDIATMEKLAKSKIAGETSLSAQDLRLAAERDPDSAVIKMREIMQARKEALEKRLAKKGVKISEAKKLAEKEIKKSIKKSTKATWNSFIEDIAC